MNIELPSTNNAAVARWYIAYALAMQTVYRDDSGTREEWLQRTVDAIKKTMLELTKAAPSPS